MYVPPQFREERPEVLAGAIRGIQLATLVTMTPDGLVASHIPMILKDQGGELVLEGHVARQNEHWRGLGDAGPSLAIFQGPQAYVSPAWYASKREHGKVVPTWNYIAVHAHGRVEAIEDPAWLAGHLDDLTRLNEGRRADPWEISDAPAGFVANLSRAIVGLRFRVERLEGAWKMIQHRSEADRLGTIAGLSQSDDPGAGAVAGIMRDLEAGRTRPGPV